MNIAVGSANGQWSQPYSYGSHISQWFGSGSLDIINLTSSNQVPTPTLPTPSSTTLQHPGHTVSTAQHGSSQATAAPATGAVARSLISFNEPPPVHLFAQDPDKIRGSRLLNLARVYSNQQIRLLSNPGLVARNLRELQDNTVTRRLTLAIESHARKRGIDKALVRKWLDGERAANEVARNQNRVTQATRRRTLRAKQVRQFTSTPSGLPSTPQHCHPTTRQIVTSVPRESTPQSGTNSTPESTLGDISDGTADDTLERTPESSAVVEPDNNVLDQIEYVDEDKEVLTELFPFLIGS
ncbi:hypothetical protein BAUCODRAFT_156634 [Baudoinia panamericana UAMH 10762]|uniref:Uncharacterized protein n=1 Tax=Baudoinia panamericana (strain UAMH 10762) TaxID=717646 RepID=M2MII9_BAUPA|nr:uncharacterized protein BAUCODRAFT_156634 [Baudoinia panamericana UAMH 10762]EMC96476.1 hypothetical protein BAUCODRAFT_156634 [Baudoinia panamericana UAMH 10762]